MSDLYPLNDALTSALADRGWVADTEDDYDRLNNLTHEVAALVDAFITPPPATEVDPHEAIRAIAHEHALVVNIWSPEDVQSLSGYENLSDDEAAEALDSVEKHLNDRLTELGWEVLETLLSMR